MKLDDVMKLQHFVGILTAIHMCIILYFPWVLGPKKVPLRSQASSCLAWLKGVAAMPRGAAGTRGQDPWGHVTSLSSHIKLWKAAFTDPNSCFLLFLCSAASLRGWRVVFGEWVLSSCWTALPWNTLGVPWFRLSCPGLFSSEEDLTIPAQIQESN